MGRNVPGGLFSTITSTVGRLALFPGGLDVAEIPGVCLQMGEHGGRSLESQSAAKCRTIAGSSAYFSPHFFSVQLHIAVKFLHHINGAIMHGR